MVRGLETTLGGLILHCGPLNDNLNGHETNVVCYTVFVRLVTRKIGRQTCEPRTCILDLEVSDVSSGFLGEPLR